MWHPAPEADFQTAGVARLERLYGMPASIRTTTTAPKPSWSMFLLDFASVTYLFADRNRFVLGAPWIRTHSPEQITATQPLLFLRPRPFDLALQRRPPARLPLFPAFFSTRTPLAFACPSASHSAGLPGGYFPKSDVAAKPLQKL